MPRKPTITFVGPGRLGTALARALHRAGYNIPELVSRNPRAALARSVGARAARFSNAELNADIIWLTVSDGAIASCAQQLGTARHWRNAIVFHASGALTSRELAPLRRRGAAVASVHPMMTFVAGVVPSLAQVTFAVEGDGRAIRAARAIARSLGGTSFVIDARHKPAYHAWGAFTSPLIVALLTASEQVARRAGLDKQHARRIAAPIVQQTISNYFARGPEAAFSGPLIRGDVATVAKHLDVLTSTPDARDVYMALANSALRLLPTHNRRELAKLLKVSAETDFSRT